LRKKQEDEMDYWNMRETKPPVVFFVIIACLCLLLAHFVSRMLG